MTDHRTTAGKVNSVTWVSPALRKHEQRANLQNPAGRFRKSGGEGGILDLLQSCDASSVITMMDTNTSPLRSSSSADQMCHGVFRGGAHPRDDGSAPRRVATAKRTSLSLPEEDPFFAFSMADVTPDFGEESHCPSEVAKTVPRVFRSQRTEVAPAVAS